MQVKILMVCLGNICRSPLAEGILASKLPSQKFFVDSAGTGDYHIGLQPDQRSINIAFEKGLDISTLSARQFSTNDFLEFDYIYVMDYKNYEDVIKLATDESQKNKVQLIMNELYPDKNIEVPDPYFGLENGFEIVYDMLEKSCDAIAKKLIKTQK